MEFVNASHLPSRSKPMLNPKLVKECVCPNRKRKFKIFFPALQKKLKHPTRRPTRQRHGNSTTTMVYKAGGQNASTQQRFCKSGGAVLRMTVKWLIKI